MPTTRPRHTVTETEEVAAAIDAAARRWPEDAGSRSRLIVRLIAAGHEALGAQEARRRVRRRVAVERTRGVLRGTYPDGYLRRLRDEWPA